MSDKSFLTANYSGILQTDDTKPLVTILTDLISPHMSCKIAFEGALGAGKTRIIKDFLTSLGVLDEITSPSYTLCNEYEADGKHFEHWDIFRLTKAPEELIQSSDTIQLIEWGLKFSEIKPHIVVKINLDHEIRRFEVFTETTS